MRLRIVVLSFVLLGIGCANPVEPRSIPLQFDVVAVSAAVDIVTIETGPGSVTVSTNYVGSACSPFGGFAQLQGSTLRVTVTPNRSTTACDAVGVLYVYHARLLGLEAGTYTLELYHGNRNGTGVQLIERSSVQIPAGAI